MSINWNNIRTLNGSQQSAFEELCCQLARSEPTPPESRFMRVGAPDAGVECYWILPTGDEWGWQAKFFTVTPGDIQWKQVDESVRTALKKHPRLTVYTVCIPLDRADPRIENRRSFQDRWDAQVAKWHGLANEAGMSVDFRYWGSSEHIERLSREEHRGRNYFWFNTELFSDIWFQDHLNESIANVGPRYTPEVNVALPIARLFDGLGRTPAFFQRLNDHITAVRKQYRYMTGREAELVAKSEYEALSQKMKRLTDLAKTVSDTGVGVIEWTALDTAVDQTVDAARVCTNALEKARDQEKERDTSSKPKQYRQELYTYEIDHLRGLQIRLYQLRAEINSDETALTNVRALLIIGGAGTGKTHLFCDVAEQRMASSHPSVLLLGEQFGSDEPWSHIIHSLGLSCTRDEFLSALDAAAEARKTRAILFIDALNEGTGKQLWKRHLAGMLKVISRYAHVGIAVSVRSSYEELVIPHGIGRDRLIRYEHLGFSENEYAATKIFFDHYHIERPSIPLLVPEFSNPLFLKLFCMGIHNAGLNRIPDGFQGITKIFDFFIDQVQQRLSRPEYLDYNYRSQPVQQAIKNLIHRMTELDRSWLPHGEAQGIVDEVLPPQSYESSLFRGLIVEGILAEDRFCVGEETNSDNRSRYEDVVRLTYERLFDHLSAAHLLDTYLDESSPGNSFVAGTPLYERIADESTCYRNSGLLAAFSIQLPERIGKELMQLAPHTVEYEPARSGLIESILWRKTDCLSDETLRLVNKHILVFPQSYQEFVNTLLLVSANPDHPYNADFLHRNLIRRTLADRDAEWSIFLHKTYANNGTTSPAGRLVDWAWKMEDKDFVGDESIRLIATALTWFLTTSHRALRDRATKALVALLQDRMHILIRIIEAFHKVNDPYVSARLYAVAYGCCMRSTNGSAIRPVAQVVYDLVFRHSNPPPDILLRDYARGVVERALNLEVELDVNPTLIRPPYTSRWPESIPSKEELEVFGHHYDGMPQAERAQIDIYSSVMDWGDFARYVIGTNSHTSRWSSRRLTDPRQPSRRERYEAFKKSLTPRQRKCFAQYEHERQQRIHYPLAQAMGKAAREMSEGSLKRRIHVLRKSLGQQKTRIFHENVLPYLNNPSEREDQFDLSIIQRLVLQKVFDLGWTIEKFGQFDRYVNYHDMRKAAKPERIGKKYQWIAYYEVLARMVDNFAYQDDFLESDQNENPYEGPWQLSYIRDIDPSVLVEDTVTTTIDKNTPVWWSPVNYDWGQADPEDSGWLKTSEDLPDVPQLLSVQQAQERTEWLVLYGFRNWREPVDPEDEDLGRGHRREIWYRLSSYLVDKRHITETLEWAKQQDFTQSRPDETHELNWSIFYGELYWSPCYQWEDARTSEYRKPKEIGTSVTLLSTTEQFGWERTYDMSGQGTVRTYVPTHNLARHLGVRWQGIEGHFHDKNGHLVAWDPSVREMGPDVLLVRKEQLLQYLRDNGLALLWTIRGEKQSYRGSGSPGSFPGLLYISGSYSLDENGEVVGTLNAEFRRD